MRRSLVVTAAVAAVLATVGAVALASVNATPKRPVEQAAASPGELAPLSARRVVTGWLPYWDLPEALSSVLSEPSVFAEVSPFWYRVTTSAQVAAMEGNEQPESELIDAIEQLHGAGIAALPTVKDDDFDGHDMARLLRDRDRRKTLVDQIDAMVSRTGADGVDIDFEGMNFGGSGRERTDIKRLYPVFLGQLQKRLNAQDKTLSVALPPRRSHGDSYWEVIDYRAISGVVDRARVMTYDYSTDSPGPVAPYAWTKQVAAYAQKEFRGVPLSIGVPAYGRNWYLTTLRGKCPPVTEQTTTPTTVQALALAEQFSAAPEWSKSAREYHYDYRRPYPEYGRCVTERSVWFGDSRSAAERLLLAKHLGVQGIAVFSFGSEDSRLLTRAAALAAGFEPAKARVTIAAPTTAAAADQISITGTAAVRGIPVASAEIVLQRRAHQGAWDDVATATSDESGRVEFDVTINGSTSWRLRVAAGWDWARSNSEVRRTTVS